jgi:DNA topoisomerase-2
MFKASEPIITPASYDADFTKITFEPDFSKFGVVGDIAQSELIRNSKLLIQRRVVDVAGCLGAISVSLNGTVIDVKSFADYIKMYSDSSSADSENLTAEDKCERDKTSMLYAKINDRWEVGVIPSPVSSFESVSFVNSVWTSSGGTHVNHVMSQIVDTLEAQVVKKVGKAVNAGMIRNKLMLFLRCNVENPSFDSQSKNTLTTKPSSFGSECSLPKSFLKSLVQNLGIVEDIVASIKFGESLALLKASASSAKKSSTLVAVPKLDDAHFAGHAQRALECTLILTEGDSAKALAVAGLEVVGRETFGVLPLKGKLLNVRVATTRQLTGNEELMNLCKAIGLDFNSSYEDGIENRGLRYGSILLMCDQDTDGSHIKGLVINFFHKFWPALLRREGFLQQFITPLVKVKEAGRASDANSDKKPRRGKISNPGEPRIQSFYSMLEYLQWRLKLSQETDDSPVKYTVKYYKGLGTNTAAEGREYFSRLQDHKKIFISDRSEDDPIDMVFSKTRADDRKSWLMEGIQSLTEAPAVFIDPAQAKVLYSDFINKELIYFSMSDNQRSIPSVIDGLKPSQRKVLYSCLKKNLVHDSKVVQVAGYVAEKTAYHHGEASLHSTIIRMAQDFVGSNNIPLLVPSGQFGSRAEGGQDYASARYIFTRLSPLTRLLFPPEDDNLLEYLEEDGILVEPKYYIPILPTLLINGSDGIGTGWSTSVPTFHPLQLAKQVIARIRSGGSFSGRSLQPWTRGFTGKIKSSGKNNGFISQGTVTRTSKTKLAITELPLGVWTNDYKEFLVDLVKEGAIKAFSEHHTSSTVKFEVSATQAWLDEAEKIEFNKVLKLQANVSTRNMHAFDAAGKIKLYTTAEDIIEEHFHVRREAYICRKEVMAAKLAKEARISSNKSRFIDCIIRGELAVISKDGGSISEHHLLTNLRNMNFETMKHIKKSCDEQYLQASRSRRYSSSELPDVDGDFNGYDDDKGYDYLSMMPIHSLTRDKQRFLTEKAEQGQRELEALLAITPEEMWIKDLELLVNRLSKSMM